MSIEKRKAEIKAMCEFDEKVAFDMSVSDDLQRFQGKFPNEGIELIAKIVAVSKLEGAKSQHAKTQNLASIALEAIEVLERIGKFHPIEASGQKWIGAGAVDIANECLKKLAKGAEK